MSWQVWAIVCGLCLLALGLVACAVIWPWTVKYVVLVGIILAIALFLFLETIAEAWRN